MVSKGLKKVAVIAEQTDWGQSVAKYFSDELTAKGRHRRHDRSTSSRGTPDFRSLLARSRRAKPDLRSTG